MAPHPTADGAADAVRPIDLAQQAGAERLAMLLEHAGTGSIAIRATIAHDPGAGCWLLGGDGPALRIDRLGDVPARLHPERTDAVVSALA